VKWDERVPSPLPIIVDYTDTTVFLDKVCKSNNLERNVLRNTISCDGCDDESADNVLIEPFVP